MWTKICRSETRSCRCYSSSFCTQSCTGCFLFINEELTLIKFSAALNDLPKSFQDGATKVLREQSPVSQSSFPSSTSSTLPNPKISSNKSYERKSSHGTLSPNHYSRTTERYYTPERTSSCASPAPSSVKDEIRNISEQITMMNFSGEMDDDSDFLKAEKVKLRSLNYAWRLKLRSINWKFYFS